MPAALRILATDAGASLTAAASEPASVDVGRRTITGLAVPFGKAGSTSLGSLTFAAGSIRWGDPKRVKLLTEHDQRQPVGYATELTETPAGIVATFYVPEGEAGDKALTEAANGLRDGLSVGVMPDPATLQRLRRANGGAVAASGQLRETSLVSVPAFDDARVDTVAAGATGLVISAWSDTPTPTEGEATVPCQTCGHVHAPGTPCVQAANSNSSSSNSSDSNSGGASSSGSSSGGNAGGSSSGGSAGDGGNAGDDGGPAIVRINAGAATYVTGEPATYTFAGTGHCLVRDVWAAATEGDTDARARLARANAELSSGNPASVMALAAVAATGDAPDSFTPTGYRPDLMRQAINAGRPGVSRVGVLPISNSNPFYVPVEGEFSGVGDHTEGTAHVAEGTLGLGEQLVTPTAVSGAYRLSRELVDSSNPAVDVIAVRAMVRDYRRKSEAKLWAAIAAVTTPIVASVGDPLALRDAQLNFTDDEGIGAAWTFGTKAFVQAILGDVASDGRPQLPFLAPGNTVGQVQRGYVADVDGVPLVRAGVQPGAALADAVMVKDGAVAFFESGTQLFRFEQTEGPGIIKLALWAYNAAKVLVSADVQPLKIGA